MFLLLLDRLLQCDCIQCRLKTVDASQTHSPETKQERCMPEPAGWREEGVLHITECQTAQLLSCSRMPAEERWQPNMWWRCSQR